MIKLFFTVILLSTLLSCYGVNEETTEISNLTSSCLNDHPWDSILKLYPIENVEDSIFKEKIIEIGNEPIQCEILFFSNSPKELIAISSDHYSIRYVYNPQISDKVLDGLSKELSNKEKKRIRNRVLTILMKFQCPSAAKETKKKMKDPID